MVLKSGWLCIHIFESIFVVHLIFLSRLPHTLRGSANQAKKRSCSSSFFNSSTEANKLSAHAQCILGEIRFVLVLDNYFMKAQRSHATNIISIGQQKGQIKICRCICTIHLSNLNIHNIGIWSREFYKAHLFFIVKFCIY